VLAAESDVEGILCLGDLVNYGPFPAECVRWAQTETLPLWTVQGNHDFAFAHDTAPNCSLPYQPYAAVMQRATLGLLTRAQREFLGGLPRQLSPVVNGARTVLCHATPSHPLTGYYAPDDARWPDEVAAAGRPDFLFVGHTHQPFVRTHGRTTVVNPGSVGQPKHGDACAAYAVWQDHEIFLRKTAYDLAPVERALFSLAPAEIAAPLCHVLRTGGKLPAD
jgi:predicted phosphodiesterase